MAETSDAAPDLPGGAASRRATLKMWRRRWASTSRLSPAL